MKISIVTVCENPGKLLNETIDSVLSQTYQNIEYIIVDSQSTDKTIKILESYSKKYQNLKWLSEPDTGIYNAMNKAVDIVSGKYIYFLNAGDMFYDVNIIANIIKKLEEFTVDFLYTDIALISGNDTEQVIKKYDNVCRYFLFKDCINHQASFYRLNLIKKLGGYDEKFKITADYDLLMKIMEVDSVEKEYFPIVTAKYGLDGISSRMSKQLDLERSEIIKNHFSIYERMLFNNIFYQFYRRRLRKMGLDVYG